MNLIKEKPLAFAMIIVYFIFHLLIWVAHAHETIQSTNIMLRRTTYFWIFFTFYTIVSYFSSAFSDPGFHTKDWNENHPNSKVDINDKDNKLFCDKCKISRPLRSHHCKECNKCVYLFDHHCVFVSNCIGFRTLRPYFTFLLAFPCDGICAISLLFGNMGIEKQKPFKGLVFAFSLFYYLVFLLIDAIQFYELFYNLVINSCEVENERDKSQKEEYDMMCIDQVAEFNTRSIFKNFQQKLGGNPLAWFIPLPRNDIPDSNYVKNPNFTPYSQLHPKKKQQNDVPKSEKEGVVTKRQNKGI